jgi:DMSO/TMAO reductase YedYZ molybdopterin-dependent catalytic subunit
MVSGIILMLLTQAGTIDLTPFMPFVPEAYTPYVHVAVNMLPLVLSVMGWIDEQLRNKTTAPIELVAIPDKVVAENPRVAEAVAMADQTKTEAVAVTVTEAKAA